MTWLDRNHPTGEMVRQDHEPFFNGIDPLRTSAQR
jgi:hypothetical protein